MGLYDSVYFDCPTPGCCGTIEVQSKAGECCMAQYSPDDVPVEIAADIGGEPAWCRVCDNTYTVAKSLPSRVGMHLVGSSAHCQHCGK